MRYITIIIFLLFFAFPAFAEQPAWHLGITPDFIDTVVKAGTEQYAGKLVHPKGKHIWALRQNKENVGILLAEEKKGMVSRIQVIAVQSTDAKATQEQQEGNTMGATMLLCGGMAVTQGDIKKTSSIFAHLKERLDKDTEGIVALADREMLYLLRLEKLPGQNKQVLSLIIIPAMVAVE